jgi:hypothetical protein
MRVNKQNHEIALDVLLRTRDLRRKALAHIGKRHHITLREDMYKKHQRELLKSGREDNQEEKESCEGRNNVRQSQTQPCNQCQG